MACWADQLVYRVQISGLFVFVSMIVMTYSGCAEGAARYYVGGKFLLVSIISTLLLLVPNTLFSSFGEVATSACACFLVVQAVLLIDFAYSWNELWHSNALAAFRREVRPTGYYAWTGAIVGASLVLLCGSIACSVHLYAAFDTTSGRWINIVALAISFVLLVVSITDWCEHGALLTSSVVMAYTAWLLCEMLSVMPSGSGPSSPTWLRLAVGALSLASAAQSANLSSTAGGVQGRLPSREEPLRAAEGGALSTPAEDSGGAASSSAAREGEEAGEGEAGGVDKQGFAVQCAVHAAATLYVAASLAPRPGVTSYAFHTVAVFMSLALYGWSLVAPKVLTGRTFA